ncbi:hypothetical protein TanjilG_06419 [Lupinus angustifolius]|uniref:FLZ-type domain-containing protein n=2 Tax=Lupinus angustifolius TaxID=3871 RepID=A0A1J7GWQ4_LUPAN|nr:hypothetical protein TanjilG_06419 [Lupinus angustifolius]
MADHHTSSSPQQSTNQTYATTILPSLFASPKFIDFTNNNYLSGTEALRTPTSVLDTKPLISPFGFFGYPFSYAYNRKSSYIHRLESKNIGLALVSALKDEPFDENSGEPNKGNVLFGTKLRLKVKESQNKDDSTREVVEGVVSMSEMELSEEYTCVISHHGPNKKTTHIFNNCIVEENYSHFSVPKNSHLYAISESFLSFCYTCKKHLDQTKDIFIYRGEKAFCSPECRYREMVLDHNSESDIETHS